MENNGCIDIDEMDANADKIIESYANADSSKSIEDYTKEMGERLNGVYGATLALPLDQLVGYGWVAGQWALTYGVEKGFDYLLPKVGKALKRALDDRAAGKKAPTKEEFGKRLVGRSLSLMWSVDGQQ